MVGNNDSLIKMDVHSDFRDLIIRIQGLRIGREKETWQTKISLWKLTKTVVNLLDANPELIDSLVEVKINDGI